MSVPFYGYLKSRNPKSTNKGKRKQDVPSADTIPSHANDTEPSAAPSQQSSAAAPAKKARVELLPGDDDLLAPTNSRANSGRARRSVRTASPQAAVADDKPNKAAEADRAEVSDSQSGNEAMQSLPSAADTAPVPPPVSLLLPAASTRHESTSPTPSSGRALRKRQQPHLSPAEQEKAELEEAIRRSQEGLKEQRQEAKEAAAGEMATETVDNQPTAAASSTAAAAATDDSVLVDEQKEAHSKEKSSSGRKRGRMTTGSSEQQQQQMDDEHESSERKHDSSKKSGSEQEMAMPALKDCKATEMEEAKEEPKESSGSKKQRGKARVDPLLKKKDDVQAAAGAAKKTAVEQRETGAAEDEGEDEERAWEQRSSSLAPSKRQTAKGKKATEGATSVPEDGRGLAEHVVAEEAEAASSGKKKRLRKIA